MAGFGYCHFQAERQCRGSDGGFVYQLISDFTNSSCEQDTDDSPATDPSEARPFSTVISGLQRSYPKEKMEEISTSFCFICLLHLANEQGLKLESVQNRIETETEMDVVDEEKMMDDHQVGNIWDLRVCRPLSYIPNGRSIAALA
jgi:Condensin complex subunit 2